MSSEYSDVFKYFSIIIGLLSSCSMLYLESLRINQKYQQIFNKWLINEIILMKFYLIKYILEDSGITNLDIFFDFFNKTLSAYSLLVLIILLCSYIHENNDNYEEANIFTIFTRKNVTYVYVIINVLLGPYLQGLMADGYDKLLIFVYINLVLTMLFVTRMTCCGSKRMDESYLIAGVSVLMWFLYFLERGFYFNGYLSYIVNLTSLFIIIVMKQLTKYNN